MNQEYELKSEVTNSLSQVTVPASLYRFARQVPELVEQLGDTSRSERPRRRRLLTAVARTAAAVVLVAGAITVGVSTSPAFASYMKEVPGFHVAVEWLTQLRERDGVQVAVDNGYTPFESKTVQFGGTTVTLSDIYLTDDELLFKTFIRTDEYDVTDGRSPVHFFVSPSNLRGGGSTTGQSLAETEDGSGQPVLQASYKYQLEAGALQAFLASGEKELQFEVTRHTIDRDAKKSNVETAATIAMPFDQSKLLHNIVKEPKQRLAISAADSDWKGLTLEKLTIQPTTMNVILSGLKDGDVYFPREEEAAPYLKDDKGNVFRYDPSGPGLLLGDGKYQLPFLSSVFFDKDVQTLSLHIGELRVTGHEPSGSFELSLDETYPKTVHFRERDIVIQKASYHEEGYLHLEIAKDRPEQTQLEGVAFEVKEDRDVPLADQEQIDRLSKLRETLGIYGFGVADSYGNDNPVLDLYVPAPKQGTYTIELRRWNDKVTVDKDFPIELKP